MTNLEVINAHKGAGEEQRGAASDAVPRPSITVSKPGAGAASSHEQIIAMCSEVDLLSLAQADTGEPGKRSGERVTFRSCPICGHLDCFSVYTDSNTFACFSESMRHLRKPGAQAFGGNVCDYLRWARHGGDNAAAIAELREITNTPNKRVEIADRDAEDAQDGSSDGFPPITRSRAPQPPRRAPVLIEGILRHGHTMLVTARSKAGKTFLMLELAVSVSNGIEWLGFRCERGRVLFVNPEVDPASAENRLHDVAEAMRADLQAVAEGVDFWHLRGHAQGIEDTSRALFARVSRGDYSLIILDSVYELYSGDENSAEDAREFFHAIDRISKQLGCAVAMTHHHAKGIRADLDSLDRGSGSGVFGRKPDAPLDLLQVFPPKGEESTLEPGVTVWRVSDSGLREFPGIEPFDVMFKYPRHLLVPDNMTADWKPRSGQQNGGRQTGEGNRQKGEARAARCVEAIAAAFIAGGIGSEGMSATDAAEVASQAIGEPVKAQTLKGYIDASALFCVEQTSTYRWRVVPRRAPDDSPLIE